MGEQDGSDIDSDTDEMQESSRQSDDFRLGDRVQLRIGGLPLSGTVALDFTDDFDNYTVEIDAEHARVSGLAYVVCPASTLSRDRDWRMRDGESER